MGPGSRVAVPPCQGGIEALHSRHPTRGICARRIESPVLRSGGPDARWQTAFSRSRGGSTGKGRRPMALPAFNMRQLLEAGCHFGHQSHRWNPEDGAVHLRRPQQHPHHRSGADGAAAAPGARQGQRRGGRRRPRAVRRHQAAGLRRHRRRRQALGAVLHQSPLARRHADQLEDHLPVDPPPQAARGDCWPARPRAAPRRRSCSSRATATRSTSRWAASRRWAACRTCCS